MLNAFYIQPLWLVIVESLAAIVLWVRLGGYIVAARGKARLWRQINGLLFLVTIGVILYATLLDRSSEPREVVLRPFQSFIEAQEQPELYRSMLMNALLFVPFGLSLSELVPWRWHWGTLILTVFAGCLLSAGIEFLQYWFGLGRAEIDDVICNAFGTAVGAMMCTIRKHANAP